MYRQGLVILWVREKYFFYSSTLYSSLQKEKFLIRESKYLFRYIQMHFWAWNECGKHVFYPYLFHNVYLCLSPELQHIFTSVPIPYLLQGKNICLIHPRHWKAMSQLSSSSDETFLLVYVQLYSDAVPENMAHPLSLLIPYIPRYRVPIVLSR